MCHLTDNAPHRLNRASSVLFFCPRDPSSSLLLAPISVLLFTNQSKVSLRFRLPSWRVMGRLCTLIFNVSVKSSGTVGLALSSPRSPPSRQDGIPRPAHHNHSPQCNSIRGQSRQQAGRRQHDRAADLSHQEALAGRAARDNGFYLRVLHNGSCTISWPAGSCTRRERSEGRRLLQRARPFSPSTVLRAMISRRPAW